MIPDQLSRSSRQGHLAEKMAPGRHICYSSHSQRMGQMEEGELGSGHLGKNPISATTNEKAKVEGLNTIFHQFLGVLVHILTFMKSGCTFLSDIINVLDVMKYGNVFLKIANDGPRIQTQFLNHPYLNSK